MGCPECVGLVGVGAMETIMKERNDFWSYEADKISTSLVLYLDQPGIFSIVLAAAGDGLILIHCMGLLFS